MESIGINNLSMKYEKQTIRYLQIFPGGHTLVPVNPRHLKKFLLRPKRGHQQEEGLGQLVGCDPKTIVKLFVVVISM